MLGLAFKPGPAHVRMLANACSDHSAPRETCLIPVVGIR
jgi:hypothetical protein